MYRRLDSKKTTPASFGLFIFILLIINFFAFAPKISDPLAGFFGFGRGLDLLLVLGVSVSIYLLFKLYVKIDDLNQDITELVRELAIREEIDLEKIEINRNIKKEKD